MNYSEKDGQQDMVVGVVGYISDPDEWADVAADSMKNCIAYCDADADSDASISDAFARDHREDLT